MHLNALLVENKNCANDTKDPKSSHQGGASHTSLRTLNWNSTKLCRRGRSFHMLPPEAVWDVLFWQIILSAVGLFGMDVFVGHVFVVLSPTTENFPHALAVARVAVWSCSSNHRRSFATSGGAARVSVTAVVVALATEIFSSCKKFGRIWSSKGSDFSDVSQHWTSLLLNSLICTLPNPSYLNLTPLLAIGFPNRWGEMMHPWQS